MMLSVMMVFATHPAQAASNPLVGIVDYLNYNKDVSGFAGPLKEQFKTQEDHRQIDSMIQSLQKTTAKWLWRFEMKSKDQVALRVNGRVQWTAKNFDHDSNSFEVNGQKLTIKKGESFLSFQNKAMNSLQQKTAFFDPLFFSEARAFAPLALLAVLGLGAVVAGSASAKKAPACGVLPNPLAGQKPETNRRDKFRRGQICGGMPRDYQRRIEMVSQNFKPNGFFNAHPSSHQYPHNEACVDYYAGQGPRAAALQICKCIHRKQLPCSSGGWNMFPPNPPYATANNPNRTYQQSMAVQTCEVAYAHFKGQCSSTPVYPQPLPGGGSGPYDDVYGPGKGGGPSDDPYGDVSGPGKGGPVRD
jgi:hypothetical protein